MTVRFNRRAILAGAAASAAALGINRSAWAQGPAVKPDAWADAPAVLFPRLTADGRHLAYLSEERGGKILTAVDMTTGKPQRLSIGAVQVRDLRWVDNDHILLLIEVPARRTVAARSGIFNLPTVYGLKSGSVKRILDAVPALTGVSDGDVFVIQRDGKGQVTSAGARTEDDGFSYFYAFDPETANPTLIDRGPDTTISRVVAYDGTPVGRESYAYSREEWNLEYWTGGSWKNILQYKVNRLRPSLVGLNADGKGLVVKMPAGDTDIYDYVAISADGKVSAPLVDDGYKCRPVFHPRTRLLLGFERNDGWPIYDFSNSAAANLAAKAQHATDGYRMKLADFSDDLQTAIVYSEGDDDAGTYYYIDFASGKSAPLGSTYPDLPVTAFSDKQSLSYKSGDGLPIDAYLTLPPGQNTGKSKGLPLVVMAHGRERSGLAFDFLVQVFASAGYAVLEPNYRGTAGYDAAFVAAGNGTWGDKMQSDLTDGIAALAASGTVDPKRVAILGEGPGGYLALAGALSGNYRCAIDVAGLSDPEAVLALLASGFQGTNNPAYSNASRLYGPNTSDLSLPKRARDAKAPVLIFASDQDPSMNFQQSQKMADALKSAGRPVEFVKMDNPSNWRGETAWRSTVAKGTLAYLAKYNPA